MNKAIKAREHLAALENVKAITIERCAQVADDYDDEQLTKEERRIIQATAAAIRDLKDK